MKLVSTQRACKRASASDAQSSHREAEQRCARPTASTTSQTEAAPWPDGARNRTDGELRRAAKVEAAPQTRRQGQRAGAPTRGAVGDAPRQGRRRTTPGKGDAGRNASTRTRGRPRGRQQDGTHTGRAGERRTGRGPPGPDRAQTGPDRALPRLNRAMVGRRRAASCRRQQGGHEARRHGFGAWI
jgi:hypothetical protein